MVVFGYKLKTRELITLVTLILLILAIPSSVYLVQKTQIFKSRAAGNSAGKLGVQITCDYPNSGEFDALMAQHPVVIKLMSDFGCSSKIKQISPSTIIVGRIYDGNWDDKPVENFLPNDDVGSRVNDWFGSKQGTIDANPAVDCWEGPNEPGAFNDVAMRRYARFEAERARRLNGKACIGNFSVGNPGDLNLWPIFYDALRAIQSSGGYLALHEYSAPNMRCMFEGNDGWLTGRYRKVYNNYLKPAGLEVPLIITETGETGALCSQCNCGSRQDEGWRNLGVSASDYANELKWYNSLLESDGYVKGGVIFISGHPDSRWNSFDPYPDIIGPQGLLISYGGSAPSPGGSPGPGGGSVTIKCGTTKTWAQIDAELKTAGWGGPFDHSQNELNVYNNIVVCPGATPTPPGTGGSCNIGYQSPVLKDSCSNCIAGKDPGLADSMKRLNASKFSSCPTKDLLSYWCNGGISSQAMKDCIKWKKACGSSCAGDWVMADPACNQDKCANCVLQNRDDILPFFRQNEWDVSCQNYTKIVNNWCGTNMDPAGCKQVKEGICRSSCVAGAAASPTPSPSPSTSPSPSPSPSSSPISSPSPSPTPTPSPSPTPTPSPSPTPSPRLSAEKAKFDLNNDNKINTVDVGIFKNILKSGSYSQKYDFNYDGRINTLDYAILVSNLR